MNTSLIPGGLRPRRILVTGGAGFIGSALIRYLIEETEPDLVLNVDCLTYAGNRASLRAFEKRPDYYFIKADIGDEAGINTLFNNFEPDAVFHLAAESHVDRSIAGSKRFIETNILGTYNLLENARRYWQALPTKAKEHFRFLHVSTDEVYGSLGPEGLFTETTAYDPSSPYSASKAASDHLVKAWYRTYGLPTITTNCSNNYGPYQFPEKLIPNMILKALAGEPLPVYGDGGNVRDWLYVLDHVKALYTVLGRGLPGETYNVGGRSEKTNLEVVRAICAALEEIYPGQNFERLITFVPDRPGHDRRYAIDAGKIERELGWAAQEDFESGLRKTVAWYLDNADWWEPLRKNIYAGERIGLAV